MTTEHPAPDIEAIKARLNAATPGPWRRSKFGFQIVNHDTTMSIVEQSYHRKINDTVKEMETMEANAELICKAPTDIAALLAENEKLRAENERLRGDLTMARINAEQQDDSGDFDDFDFEGVGTEGD